MAFENLFIRTKRKIGGIQLDSVTLEEHNSSLTKTQNPIEAGADITDHSYIEPSSLTIRGIVTDTPLGAAAIGQLIDSISGIFGSTTTDSQTRSQQAFSALEALKNAREPIEVSTKLKVYSNMLITNISVPQDKDTSRAAFLTIDLEEVFITSSQELGLTVDDLASDVSKTATATVEKGRKQLGEATQSVGSSILKTVSDWLGG